MKNKCEVCNDRESVGVCCVPGVPISCAYCKECLQNNSHPIGILIANTASLGGLDQAADWWKEMVSDSLQFQNKTLEWFNAEVSEAISEVNNLGE
jgi:hypothetical protein